MYPYRHGSPWHCFYLLILNLTDNKLPLASFLSRPQTIRTLPKRSVLYVPGFGQLLWALECPFLTRNFARDESTIKKTSEVYKDYPFPIQVGRHGISRRGRGGWGRSQALFSRFFFCGGGGGGSLVALNTWYFVSICLHFCANTQILDSEMNIWGHYTPQSKLKLIVVQEGDRSELTIHFA